MKLDLKRLKNHPRQSETFYLQSRGNDEFLATVGGKFLAPIEVEIVVENTGTIYAAHGKVKTLLQLSCARCLKDFPYPIETELSAAMVEQPGSDEYSVDEGFILFAGDEVEISSAIEEAIFMAIPLGPLCQESCLGLCPICGQDKNIAKCSCQQDDLDPRWEKLKNLE